MDKQFADFHGLSLRIRLDNLADETQKMFRINCLDFGKELISSINELLKKNGLEAELSYYELSSSYPNGFQDEKTQ